MSEKDHSSAKLLSSAQDEADRQQSSSTVASAGGGERAASQDSLLPLSSPPPQQKVKSVAAETAAAAQSAPQQWKTAAAEQYKEGNLQGNSKWSPNEALNGCCSPQPFTYDMLLSSTSVGCGNNSEAVANIAGASTFGSPPSASRPQHLSVCVSSSSSNNSLNSCMKGHRSQAPNQQHAQLHQQSQQEQPVSCIIIEGYSGELAYIEFVPQGDLTGLQLLARARRRGNSSGLLRVAAGAFDSSTVAVHGQGEIARTTSSSVRKPHTPTIAVQQLRPLLQQSPVLSDARERGVGGGTSPGIHNGSGPRCWVVGYEELIAGLLPAWRSLSSESRISLLSAVGLSTWQSFFHLLGLSQNASLLPRLLQAITTQAEKGDRSLRRRLKKALSTLQGFRIQLEDQQQLLAKTRFLRRHRSSSNSSNTGPQEALQKIIQCYVGISRLAEETHAAADDLLQHVRNGKQLQQQLQQQQLHFAAALGRIDSFAHSLQQLQQLARQEEQQLQQMQQQQKQHIWKLMDQWSSGEIEMQQQLLKTVLQIAAADARHLDDLRDAWIQLTCLCALPRKLAADDTVDATQAKTTATTESAAGGLVDTLPAHEPLARRIGLTKESAPRLLLLCLMLGADELAVWVIHWIDACMPIAAPSAETGCSGAGRAPGCKDRVRRSSCVPTLVAAEDFASGIAEAQEGMQPEANVYTPEIFALLRRRLLRIRACSHLPRCSSKMAKARIGRSAATYPSDNMHEGPYRSSSLTTENTTKRQYASAAAEASAAPAAAHAPAEAASKVVTSSKSLKTAATGICPSPASRRSYTTDAHAPGSTLGRHKMQHQQQNGAAATAVQSPPAASTTYAYDYLGMVEPLLESEEEAQLVRQMRTHDLLLLQRQQQNQQHWRQEQQQKPKQQFAEQLNGVITPPDGSSVAALQQMHQMYNGMGQVTQEQLLLLQQQKEELLQMQQRTSYKQQLESFAQLDTPQMPPVMPSILSPQEHQLRLLKDDTEKVLHPELLFLQQKNPQQQQRRVQSASMSQTATAAAVAPEPRRSSRRLTSPATRQLSVRRRQQQAGVFAAAPPKSSNSSMSPNSRGSSVKGMRGLSPPQYSQQASEPNTKPPAAAMRSKSVAAKPAVVARRSSSPQQHQKQEEPATISSTAHTMSQQQHYTQWRQKQHITHHHDSEQYTALDLTLQRIFRVPGIGNQEVNENGPAAAEAAAAAAAVAVQVAKRQQQGMGMSGEERKALADKLRMLAQQLHNDEDEPHARQKFQDQQPQQQEKQLQNEQQQQQLERQKQMFPNMSMHADSVASASPRARDRRTSSGAVDDGCLVSLENSTERHKKGSSRNNSDFATKLGGDSAKPSGPTAATNKRVQGSAASPEQLERREMRHSRCGYGFDTAAEAVSRSAGEFVATRSVSPPTAEKEQQARIIQVLDILMRQIETSQSLAVPSGTVAAAEPAAAATNAETTRRVSLSFFPHDPDEVPEKPETLQQKEGRGKTKRNPATQTEIDFAGSGTAEASPSKVAARHVHQCSSRAALSTGLGRQGQQECSAASGVSRIQEDSVACATENDQHPFPTSMPSLAESCTSCSDQCILRRNHPPAASELSKGAATGAASFERNVAAGTTRRRQHDPYSKAVLQLLHDEEQQQQQKEGRKQHQASTNRVQRQQSQQNEAFSVSISPQHRSISRHHSLPQRHVDLARPAAAQHPTAKPVAQSDSGTACNSDEGASTTQPEAKEEEAEVSPASAARREAPSEESITVISKGQQQQQPEQHPSYGVKPNSSKDDSLYASSNLVGSVTVAAEAAPFRAKADAMATASAFEPDATPGALQAEAAPEASDGRPRATVPGKPSGEATSDKRQQQPRGKAVLLGNTAWTTGSKRQIQRSVISSSNISTSSNNANSYSKPAPSRRVLEKLCGEQTDEEANRNQQSTVQRHVPHHQYTKPHQQQNKTEGNATAAAAADTPSLGAILAASAHSTTTPQQQHRRERQLLLLQQQRQRLRQQQQLQQQQQLSPLEELKLRRIKVKEMALQQRLKANGLAKRLPQEEELQTDSHSKEPAAPPRPSIKELLRRRDARLMAFVRQQLMLPETEAEAETVCAANAEKGLCQQKKSVLGPPNVVLLTKKQRESLFQSNNKGDTSRRLMQDPEEQRQEQGACCEGRTSRGCGEVATLSLMLLHEEVQQQQKKK